MPNNASSSGGRSAARRGGRHAAASAKGGVGGLCGAPKSVGTAVRLAFGVAAAITVVLNELMLVLWPLWPPSSTPIPVVPEVICNETVPELRVLRERPQEQRSNPSPHQNTQPSQAMPEPNATSYEDLRSPLRRLPPSLMRLLPDQLGEDEARRTPRWLAFGISSVRRPQVDYLGVTLSHLFEALGQSQVTTTIAVHLADFDESWVQRTSAWLGSGFSDEVASRRLHVIHAPRCLYPERRELEMARVTLGGFLQQDLNGDYKKDRAVLIGGRETYQKEIGQRMILYWCDARRRWAVAPWGDVVEVKNGAACRARAWAPQEQEFLDSLPKGWDESDSVNSLAASASAPDAGVVAVESEAGLFLKFGDSPRRQWWRSKQNLDYAFLMWYAAGLSDYYMQLEDDVQVVPDFLERVYAYTDRSLMGQAWSMVAFSKLGFIGKFFNSSHLPHLADFLLVFWNEIPCDWLVWVWIDAVSATPVSCNLADDLENDWVKWEDAKRKGLNATEAKLAPLREELMVLYKDHPASASSIRARGKPWQIRVNKPDRGVNGKANPRFPGGVVGSTMVQYKHYGPDRCYPPGDSQGFWTSDTCWGKPDCDATNKFVQIVFNSFVTLTKVQVLQGNDEHKLDYIRNGSLSVGFNAECTPPYHPMATVTSPRVDWSGLVPQARCLRLGLRAPQQEWIMVSSISVDKLDRPKTETSASPTTTTHRASTTTIPSVSHAETTKPPEKAPLLEASLAAAAGLIAGASGWGLVLVGRRFCSAGMQTVGAFTCWATSFALVLDVLLLALLTPPTPPNVAGAMSSASSNLNAFPKPPCNNRSHQQSVGHQSLDVQGRRLLFKGGRDSGSNGENSRDSRPLVSPTWSSLTHGVRRLPLDELCIFGLPPLASSAPADPRPSRSSIGMNKERVTSARRWLTVGIVVDVVQPWRWLFDVVRQIIKVGSGAITVAVLLAGGSRPRDQGRSGADLTTAAAQRAAGEAQLLQLARESLSQYSAEGLLRILKASDSFYPGPPVLDDNVDHAILVAAASQLADFYMQLEPECDLQPNFVQSLRDYMGSLEAKPRKVPFAMISLSKAGFARKILRSSLLPRLAEMLLLVPDVPVDMLFWDFLDVVGNETDPKSVSLGTLAQKSKRSDVRLQYWKNEALIEHVGDVSSLEGKVQRLRDDYFRKHRLEDTLFDTPPPQGNMRTNLGGREDMLQAVYDGSTPRTQITCGAHNALKCTDCPQGHGAAWCNVDCMWEPSHPDKCIPMYQTTAVSSSLPPIGGFLEARFKEPQDIEIVRLRMGGVLRQWQKGMEGDHQYRSALLDRDFDNALDDAELRFGRDLLAPVALNDQTLACRSYYTVDRAVGREVFWRTTRTRPVSTPVNTDVREGRRDKALNISCITVFIPQQQLRPLILRGISIRRARGCSGQGPTRRCGSGQAGTSPSQESSSAGSGLPQVGVAPQAEASREASAVASGVDAGPGLAALNQGGVDHGAAPTAEELERWAEDHFAWALTVSVAFVSGAVAGILGCSAGIFFSSPAAGRTVRRRG